jgi:hypothetical protein
LLLSRPFVLKLIERTQPTTTGSLRAGATARAGHTKSTETIPRHAQGSFYSTMSPLGTRNRLQQSPHPKRRLDGTGARRRRPNQN